MTFCQEIKDKYLWDSFITSQPNHTFLHSWAWGEFNEAMGDKVWRLGFVHNSRDRANCAQSQSVHSGLMAGMQVMKVHAKRGNFLFIPHGPIGDLEALRPPQAGGGLVAVLKALARREKVSFIRISPLLEDTQENRDLFKKLGFRPAPIHMHAETTWALDLTPSENELLMGMRKTTRNLIRRAIKEGVVIKSVSNSSPSLNVREGERGVSYSSSQAVETFYALYQETVRKHNFTPFSLTYLQNQVRMLDDCHVFTAYHHGQPLASAIIVFYGNSAFYHHGASIPSKIPAAYLLQWEAIREAKRRGHRFYNFWGIVPSSKLRAPSSKSHPWAGLTLFKTGFGGFQTNYMHAQDLPLSNLYWLNWFIETMRRRRRNL